MTQFLAEEEGGGGGSYFLAWLARLRGGRGKGGMGGEAVF